MTGDIAKHVVSVAVKPHAGLTKVTSPRPCMLLSDQNVLLGPLFPLFLSPVSETQLLTSPQSRTWCWAVLSHSTALFYSSATSCNRPSYSKGHKLEYPSSVSGKVPKQKCFKQPPKTSGFSSVPFQITTMTGFCCCLKPQCACIPFT